MRPSRLFSLSVASPSSHPTLPHSLLGLSSPSKNIRGVLTLPRGYSLIRSSQWSHSRYYLPPCSTSRVFMHPYFTLLPEDPARPFRVPEVHCVPLAEGLLLLC